MDALLIAGNEAQTLPFKYEDQKLTQKIDKKNACGRYNISNWQRLSWNSMHNIVNIIAKCLYKEISTNLCPPKGKHDCALRQDSESCVSAFVVWSSCQLEEYN
jgi:hypothetical protein